MKSIYFQHIVPASRILFVFLTKNLLILSNNVLFLLFFFSAVQPIKVPWGLELVSDELFYFKRSVHTHYFQFVVFKAPI